MDITSQIIMILGFSLASYSVVGNDVIQTLGTFISSNSKRKWHLLWLYIGGIFLAVATYAWFQLQGDIAYGRLDKIPFPKNYHWWLALPPVILVVITRFGIPVSTTFLILSVFSSKNIRSMVEKSLLGYLTAFVVAIVLYMFISKRLEKYFISTSHKYQEFTKTSSNAVFLRAFFNFLIAIGLGIVIVNLIGHYQLIEGIFGKEAYKTYRLFVFKNVLAALVVVPVYFFLYRQGLIANSKDSEEYTSNSWMIAQWISTGFLWSQWIIQDMANIFVYLPRHGALSALGYWLAIALLVGLLGLILYQRGGGIQKIVTTKTNTFDIRSATIIDFTYGIVLFIFKEYSKIPMSTTWVFVGLLAGREIALTYQLARGEAGSFRSVIMVVLKDLGKIFLGLVVSLLLVWLISYLK
ncbi:hypothetical protein [Microscilla marina]|uniref:Membrane protein, putative n=1 Tax=Microscilla marina ATCC 23134 TaxID=313606 RepID=A1ZTR4_MICM2|nr:hypothetical protein [Microscilla marina]EAY26166.1 membrane protein, putative [Microscilla marina ATCC 23134]